MKKRNNNQKTTSTPPKEVYKPSEQEIDDELERIAELFVDVYFENIEVDKEHKPP